MTLHVRGNDEVQPTGGAVRASATTVVLVILQVLAGCTDDECANPQASGCEIWFQQYNGAAGQDDVVHGVVVDGNGNTIVVGHVVEAVSQGDDVWVRKFDADGIPLWTRTHDGGQPGSRDRAWSVAVDGAGDIIVAGESGGDVWVRKYSADADVLWTRTHDGALQQDDAAWGVTADSEDNVVVVGTVDYPDGPLPGTATPWVRKYDRDGAELATWNFGEAGEARAVAVDDVGDIFIAGYEDAGPDYVNILVLKLSGDAGISEVWSRSHGGPAGGWDVANGIAVDSAGNVVVGGVIENDDDTASWVRKFDAVGTELWTVERQPTQHGGAVSVAIDETARIILGGWVRLDGNNRAGESGAFVAVLSEDGDHVWSNVDTQASVARAVAVNPGVAILGGGAYRSGGSSDAWVRAYFP